MPYAATLRPSPLPRCQSLIIFTTDLLNHDDVIGTRRVSFILYLPVPDPSWKPEYGGALELYPLSDPPTDPPTPAPKPTVSLPPSFNQFAFFEVQPGHSFHSVEEVVFHPSDPENVTPGALGQRISISGWYHRPTEEEEEWEGQQPEHQKSSLQQLVRAPSAPPTLSGCIFD
jgi:Rps23 Pro-64 3,4-dihydroxylase Tpa1-like proline 4-hydroxylase